MSTLKSLKAEKRARTGSGVLNQMRSEGWVPAVIYGKVDEPSNLKVHAKTFSDLLAASASDNILVELELEGAKHMALIKDVQHHSISGAVVHADFLAVDDSTTIKATIPVNLTGEPIGVKNGGLLEQLIYDVDIKCVPSDLPDSIDTNVTALKVGDVLSIGGLNFPEGVKPVLPGDIRVASVIKTRASQSASAGGGDEAQDAPEAAAE